MMRASDSVRRPANGLVMLFFASLVLMLPAPTPVWAQQPSLPVVNLGDTSFLDGIACPGWVTELIGQGVHDNKTANNTGQMLPESTDVGSGAALTLIAWLSHPRYLGACAACRFCSRAECASSMKGFAWESLQFDGQML
jgi:hypothetical protein